MSTLLDVFLLLAGFSLLIKGADVFVDASVNIAKKLKVSSVVIGLTIVAFGTSAPEAVVSISASIGGSADLAVANVVGSNIFNLLAVIGMCGLIKPIMFSFKEIARDFWVSVGAAAALLFMIIISENQVPRTAALFLLIAFIVYMFILIRKAAKEKEPEKDSTEMAEPKPLPRSIFFAVLGLGMILAGGQLTVNSAISIATTFGVSERIIGLTIVAVGTSLPELVTSLIASKKGQNGIAVANIIGSNIFNVLFILGVSGLISPLSVDANVMYDLFVLAAASLAFLLFATTGKRIIRFEGLSMVVMYTGYVLMLILV